MTDETYPVVRLLPKVNAQKLRFGFPWVYSDQVVLDRRTKALEAGVIVELQSGDRQTIGLAAFNAESKIICRILERDTSVAIDADWLTTKITRALSHRETLYDAPYYRLVHAEADGLPGVIIDRFGDALVVQPNAAWADARFDMLCDVLRNVVGVSTIMKNATGRARGLEGLSDESAVVCGSIDGLLPVPMNGATYMADLLGGQKTGLFYDQRPNHTFASQLTKGGRVLDVFSHVGGFSLAALAAGATEAVAVDGSQPALDLATKGAEAAGVADQFSSIKGDAFDVMAGMVVEKDLFDVVVCDPPSFAPSKPALEAGLRAYERVARLGAQLVKPGGYLVLCSCSHAADLEKFRTACLRGIGKAARSGQIIHTGAAGPDHPTHPYLAESQYLKSIFFRLD